MDPSLFLPLILILFAVPLFLSARKQRRAYAEMQQMQSSLAPGDKVITTSGLYGTVIGTTEDSIELEIAPGVYTSWLRAAVREKVSRGVSEPAEQDSDDSTDTTVEQPESSAQVAPPVEEDKKASNGR